jgi:hypothetical protein
LARSFAVAALPALGVLFAACSDAALAPTEAGTLVVGVQAEELGALAGSVHIVARVDGVQVAEETVQPGLGLPKEIALQGGTRAEVTVEARSAGAAPGSVPLLVRSAVARVPTKGKRLLRLQLQPSCAALPPAPGDADFTPRENVACDAALTCVSGRCVSADVPDDALEPYASDWAKNPPDICKPAGAGAPEVVLGTGMTDYGTLSEGQTMALERGPQGGHHIWVAVRMKNIRQSGSITTIRATVPEAPELKVPDAAYVFTFDRDEGSYCKLWGLRFQLDSGATDLRNAYKPFLGKRIAVTVEVADQAGVRATSTRTIQLAPELLCPDGTTSCNVSN